MSIPGSNMQVKVLFFGAAADAAGGRESLMDIRETATAEELVEQLRQQHPMLMRLKLLIAVNEEYAVPDAHLAPGDKVAIFTPVSGG